MAYPVADSYSCGSGEVIAGGRKLSPSVTLRGKYRTDQDRLFLDVPQNVVTVDNGTYAVTQANAALADPKTDFNWSYIGPSYNSVDKLSEWSWVNPGGDWIDRTGTPQGTAQPHFTFAANAVTSGESVYAVDFTLAAQAAQSGNLWNAYIVKSSGGSRSISSLHGAFGSIPKVSVTYSDGTAGTLKCTACVRMTSGTAYGQAGRAKAEINQSVALEFERPKKAVASAVMTITILDHTATASTISGYLANPTVNAGTVVNGLADAYPLDGGIEANASVIFAHDYADGTTWSDWVAPTAGLNVFNTANWSPHLFGLGSTDTTKLPYAYNGENIQGRWIEKNVIASLQIVDSSYSGEGFEPLAPGLGAIKSFTPGYTGADGGVVAGAGATGSSLWMLLPESDIGLLDRLFVRYYMRLGTSPIASLKNTKTVRNGSASASAIHAQAIGKCGIGQMHWTYYGGNNNIGGGNIGWTNRLVYQEMLKEAETGGLVVGQHSWDMTAYNMGYGQQGGLGGSMYQGQWYCVEIDLKLNTVDAGGVNNLNDAVLKVYIDGKLVLDRTGFSYRKLPLDYSAIAFGPNYNSTTRMGPTNPATGLPPFREIGHMGVCLNDYNGGVLPADHDRTVFYAGLVVAKSYVGPMQFDVRPSWRRSLTANTWGEIPATLLSSIDPNNNPAINPNYPSRAPWLLRASGNANTASNIGVMTPWCGGAYDDSTGTFWLPLGGGHADYGGNEPYRINLNADAPAWEMVRPPSGSLPLIAGGIPAGSTVQNNSYLLDDGLESSGVYADGRPRAIHSYRKHVYVPGVGPVMVVQGGTFTNVGESAKRTWTLNESTGEWTWRSTADSAYIGSSSGGSACYDSTRNCIYWTGNGTYKLLKLNLSTWTFSDVGTQTIASTNGVAITYIAEHDIVFQVCDYYATDFCIRDPATGAITSPSVTGSAPAINGATGMDWVPGIGMVFEVSKALYALTPTGNPKTDPWAWSVLSAANASLPDMPTQGAYTKFGYSAKLGGIYRFTDNAHKPWFFATE